MLGDVSVKPASTTGLTSADVIEMNTDTNFITSVGGNSYSFTNIDPHILRYNTSTQSFEAIDITLYQGQMITNKINYDSEMRKVRIPNDKIDRSTLKLIVYPSNALVNPRQYFLARNITELSSTSFVYFLSEDNEGFTNIEFGKNVIGVEPADAAVIEVSYINTEDEHANGAKSVVSASVIEDYSDVTFNVTNDSYGGSDRETIDDVRFLAPYSYQAQDRLLNPIDYEIFVKRNFPFVNDVKAWGGETNEPPQYGVVLLSVLTEDFTTITENIKQQMLESFTDYTVGSVTARFVDPTIFGIDLDISFSIDATRTSKTFNQLSTDINTIVSKFTDANLGQFTQRYNQAKLIDLIMNLKGVLSVSIEKTIYNDLTVRSFANPNYIVRFADALKPGSLSATNFVISLNATEHKLYDDSGIVYISYKNTNQLISVQEVGTINYQTGYVEFSTNFLQLDSTIRLYAKTTRDNYRVADNAVATINAVRMFVLND